MFIDPEIRMIIYKVEKRSLRKKRILGKHAKMIPRNELLELMKNHS